MADKVVLRTSTLKAPTIPAAVEAGLAGLQNSAPLSDEDFAHLWADLRNPEKAQQAKDFLASNNVSGQERQAFQAWANKQPKPTWNADRPDSNMLQVGKVGIAPEDVLLGANVGRAAITKGPSMAARAVNVGKEAITTAAPILKYEAVRHGLQTVGVPAPIATVLAVAASGHGGKGRGSVVAEKPLVESPKPSAMDMGLLSQPAAESIAVKPSATAAPTTPTVRPSPASTPAVEDYTAKLGPEHLSHGRGGGSPMSEADQAAMLEALMRPGVENNLVNFGWQWLPDLYR